MVKKLLQFMKLLNKEFEIASVKKTTKRRESKPPLLLRLYKQEGIF